jgi:hypothetical protein
MALTIDPIAALRSAVDAANEVGLKIQSATANKDDAVKGIIETSDDDVFVKFREGRAQILSQIETLQAKLTNGEGTVKEKAQALAAQNSVGKDFDLDAAKKDFAEKRAKVHAQKKALGTWLSDEDVATLLTQEGIKEVVTIRGTGNKSGAVGNVKRPRIATATVDGEAVKKDDGSVDFTYLAKSVGSNAETLKGAAFAAAGTTDLNSLGAGKVVDFTHDGKKFSVTISDKKPGRKPAEKTETPAPTK